jgi:hypothetical protein
MRENLSLYKPVPPKPSHPLPPSAPVLLRYLIQNPASLSSTMSRSLCILVLIFGISSALFDGKMSYSKAF